MLFQTKQALVFKAMYQSVFLAREKVQNIDGWLSDFESTTLKISLKISCWPNRESHLFQVLIVMFFSLSSDQLDTFYEHAALHHGKKKHPFT